MGQAKQQLFTPCVLCNSASGLKLLQLSVLLSKSSVVTLMNSNCSLWLQGWYAGCRGLVCFQLPTNARLCKDQSKLAKGMLFSRSAALPQATPCALTVGAAALQAGGKTAIAD